MGKITNWKALPTILGVLALVLLFCAPVLAEEATEVTDEVILTVPTSCSFVTTGTASAADMTFTGTSTGTGEVSLSQNGKHDFNVACNRSNGYTVYAYAESLSSGSHTLPFVASSSYSASGDGKWTAVVSGDGITSPAFGSSATSLGILKRTDSVAGANGDDFSVTYKVYIGDTTVAGTYEGHAGYYLALNVGDGLPNTSSYTITYNANGGTGAPAAQSGSGSYVELSNTKPTKTGFSFEGWATSAEAISPEYHAGDHISLGAGSRTMSLYAVWGEIPTMQGFRASSLAAGASVDLVDARDGKMYTVKKLADGKVWMMQDLDLDLYVENNNDTTALVAATGRMGTKGKSGNFVPFTNANTDLSGDSWTVSGSNVAYNTQKGSAQTGTSYKWNAYGTSAGAGGGTTDYYEVRSYDENSNTCIAPYETTTSDSNNTESNGHTSECDNGIGTANTQRIGNYYNWPAATAGTGTYLLDEDGGIAPDSICPKGWHIPTGLGNYNESTYTYDSTEFNDMLYAEGISDIQRDDLGYQSYTLMTNEIMQRLTGFTGATAVNPTASRLSFLRSGFYLYSGGTVRSRGLSGLYWSSTAYDSDAAYYLYFNASDLNPGTASTSKGSGRAIRCVAD